MGWQDDPVVAGWENDAVVGEPVAPVSSGLSRNSMFKAKLLFNEFKKQGFAGTQEELAKQFDSDETRKTQHSAAAQAMRDIPVGAVSGLTGLADLATLPGRAIDKGGDWLASKMGLTPRPEAGGPWFPATTAIAQPMDEALATPRNTPQTMGQRLTRDITRGVSGAAITAGLGSAASIPMLAAKPGIQLLSGATGAASAGLTREAGGGPVLQTIAGLAGGAAPYTPQLGAELIRRTMRGSDPVPMRQTIQDFAAVGTTPTVGQATQNRRMQATESLLSKSPGGAGPMVAKAQQQAQQVSGMLEDTASTLAPGATGQKTGMAIEKGVDTWVSGFKAKSGKLYEKLDTFVPKSAPVDVSRTTATLERLTKDIPDAEALSAFFKQAKVVGIQGALKSDMAGTPAINSPILQPSGKPFVTPAGPPRATMPYEAIKQIRTQIGNELADAPLMSDIPRAAYKQLYAALSEDMGATARAQGPQAGHAWKQANKFYEKGMERVDMLQRVVDKNGGPEKIFAAATSGTNEGATVLRSVMQSLPADAQKQVSATIIRRMGKALPGAQNDVGDVFSTERFLTSWSGMSPEAKRTLFDRFGPDLSKSMDKVASYASNLRSGSKVFANPSGTSQATNLAYGGAGAAGMALATGHPGAAAGILAALAANNGAARLMTNPRFVNWLALSTEAPISALPSLANQLAQSAARANDKETAEFALQLRFSEEQ